jgi:hypothetical protein
MALLSHFAQSARADALTVCPHSQVQVSLSSFTPTFCNGPHKMMMDAARRRPVERLEGLIGGACRNEPAICRAACRMQHRSHLRRTRHTAHGSPLPKLAAMRIPILCPDGRDSRFRQRSRAWIGVSLMPQRPVWQAAFGARQRTLNYR